MSYMPNPSEARVLDLVKLVQDRKEASLRYVRDRYRETQTLNDAFRGLYTGSVANHLNDITIPLVHATIMSDVARKANAIFGSWPVVTFQGFSPGSAGLAKKNELLVNLQLKEADSFRKSVLFFMKADIDGTAVADVGWSSIQKLRQFRTVGPMGEPMELRDLVTEFDGPNWDPIDLLDFWPEPGKAHISKMSWYIRRYWCDFDDLLEMNSADGFQSFDPAALKALAETGMPSAARGSDEFMFAARYRNFNDFLTSAARQAFSKPVEIWEMRGTVPYEFAPDGNRQRVITIGNGKVILRNEPDKLLLSRHRILTYSPCPDPYHFVGLGKAKIAEPLQAAAGRLMNQKLDALDLFVKPAFLGRQGAVRTQNMFVKPGRVFQIDTKGGPLSESIQPLPVNLSGVQAAMQEIAFLDGMIQKGTGIDEQSVMGMSQNSGDMTARQYLGQSEAAMTRLALEAMLASSEVVEPLAELFRDMNKVMLPIPKQFSLLGTRAILNEVTGLPNPPEEGIITNVMELNHDWKAKAFGPMFMLTKSAQRADALQLAQIMMSNPVWIQSVNWIAFARKLFGLYDWDTDEMMVQLPQVQQLAAAMGVSPEQAVAAGSGDPMAGPGGGASGQSMAPVQKGTESSDNAPLGVGP